MYNPDNYQRPNTYLAQGPHPLGRVKNRLCPLYSFTLIYFQKLKEKKFKIHTKQG